MRTLIVLLCLVLATSALGAGFGDSTQTSSRQISNNNISVGYFLANVTGTLDSIAVWCSREYFGADTLIGVIYGPYSARTFLAISNDSVLVNDDDLNRRVFHFAGKNVSITSGTSYWIGAYNLAGATAGTTFRVSLGSTVDSGAVVSDPYPLESALGITGHGLGGVYTAPTVYAWVSSGGGGGGGGTGPRVMVRPH